MIWLAFFPLSLLSSWILGHVAPDLPLVERALVSTLCLTPVMTYVVLPRMTARARLVAPGPAGAVAAARRRHPAHALG